MQKSRGANKNAVTPPKQLFEAGAALLKQAAEAASSAQKLPKSLSRCASLLVAGSERLRRKFGDAYDSGLVDALAEQCALLSDALHSMTAFEKLPDRRALVAVGEVAEATIGLSRLLVSIAETVKDEGPEIVLEPSAKAVREEFGKSAHGMFLAALSLMEAAGFPLADTFFAWPSAAGCGCSGGLNAAARTQLRDDASPEVIWDDPPAAELDKQAVGLAYADLLEELLKLFVLLALLARYLPLMLAYFDEYYYVACSQDCTGPNNRIISITVSATYSSQDGTATPMNDANVDLCCSSWCFVFSTEWDVKTKPVTGVTVGKPYGVGREAAAATFAATAPAAAALRAAVLKAPPVC